MRDQEQAAQGSSDVIMIVFCAVLSGVEDWVGMEAFGLEKEAWLRRFLELAHGISSHDTLSDVFGRIHPQAFAQAFMYWMQAALPSLGGEQVCLDGKTLRGSRAGEKAVHPHRAPMQRRRASRWRNGQSMRSANEIKAIPALLAMLDLKVAVVSINAMGCQKTIARQIVEAGAHYVLALKDNHPQLSEDVRLWLDTEAARGRLPVHETVDKDHGRYSRFAATA